MKTMVGPVGSNMERIGSLVLDSPKFQTSLHSLGQEQSATVFYADVRRAEILSSHSKFDMNLLALLAEIWGEAGFGFVRHYSLKLAV